MIWGIVCELGVPKSQPGDGFPLGFEYRFADGDKIKIPVKCSGPEYVDYVLTWVEEKLNDSAIFPSSSSEKNDVGLGSGLGIVVSYCYYNWHH